MIRNVLRKLTSTSGASECKPEDILTGMGTTARSSNVHPAGGLQGLRRRGRLIYPEARDKPQGEGRTTADFEGRTEKVTYLIHQKDDAHLAKFIAQKHLRDNDEEYVGIRPRIRRSRDLS